MGTDLAQFATHGAVVTDLDLSAGHLQLAEENFRLRGLEGRFIHYDAETLPFDDGSFDVVYSNGVLHHTPNTSAVVREIHRVLRPGGRAILMFYAEDSLHHWRKLVWGFGVKQGLLQRVSMGEIMSRSVERTANDAAPLVKVYTKPRLRALVQGLRGRRDPSAAAARRRASARSALDAACQRALAGLEPDHQGDEELTEHVVGPGRVQPRAAGDSRPVSGGLSRSCTRSPTTSSSRATRARGSGPRGSSEYVGFSGRYASNALVLSAPCVLGGRGVSCRGRSHAPRCPGGGVRVRASLVRGTPSAARRRSRARWCFRRCTFRRCLRLERASTGTRPPRRITRRSCWCSCTSRCVLRSLRGERGANLDIPLRGDRLCWWRWRASTK